MSWTAGIADALRGVVIDGGQAWEYHRRTNGLAALTPTFGAWTTVTAFEQVGESDQQEYGENTAGFQRMQRLTVLVPDTVARLGPGDEMRRVGTGEAEKWAVMGMTAGGTHTGHMAIVLQREAPIKSEPNRAGGP